MIKTQIANPAGAVNGQDERAKARRWQPRPVSQMGNQGATAKSAAALCHHKKQLSTSHNSLRREGGISYDLHRRIQRAYRVHIPRFL